MQTLQMNIGGVDGPVIPMEKLDTLQAYQMACVIHEAMTMLLSRQAAAGCGRLRHRWRVATDDDNAADRRERETERDCKRLSWLTIKGSP